MQRPNKSLIGTSPPEADASFHTGADGSTGGAKVDEAHRTGAGEAALSSAGASVVALASSEPQAVDGPPTALNLQQELQMLQKRDKEKQAKNQREKENGGTNVTKRKSPSPKPAPRKKPKAGPKARICLPVEHTRPAVPRDDAGTQWYKDGKINIPRGQECYRVFLRKEDRCDRKLRWASFGGKRAAWNKALDLIDQA